MPQDELADIRTTLVSVVSLWQSTEREGDPNVILPVSKVEMLLDHLEAIESDLLAKNGQVAELRLKLRMPTPRADQILDALLAGEDPARWGS